MNHYFVITPSLPVNHFACPFPFRFQIFSLRLYFLVINSLMPLNFADVISLLWTLWRALLISILNMNLLFLVGHYLRSLFLPPLQRSSLKLSSVTLYTVALLVCVSHMVWGGEHPFWVFLFLCVSLFALDYESFPVSSDAYQRWVFVVISQIAIPIRHRMLAVLVWHCLCVVLCIRSRWVAAAVYFLVLSTALAWGMGLSPGLHAGLSSCSLSSACWKSHLLPVLLQRPSSPGPVHELESPMGPLVSTPTYYSSFDFDVSFIFRCLGNFFFNLSMYSMYFKSIFVGFI